MPVALRRDIRELVEDHKICCPFVATVDNLADFFTKLLRASVFFPMRDRIMNVCAGDARPRGVLNRVVIPTRVVCPLSVCSGTGSS